MGVYGPQGRDLVLVVEHAHGLHGLQAVEIEHRAAYRELAWGLDEIDAAIAGAQQPVDGLAAGQAEP